MLTYYFEGKQILQMNNSKKYFTFKSFISTERQLMGFFNLYFLGYIMKSLFPENNSLFQLLENTVIII